MSASLDSLKNTTSGVMANKKGGTHLSKFRRNRDIIRAYDAGADAEALSSNFSVTERRVYQIVSPENRAIMSEWSKELGETQ